jgi:hypothetical protein
MAEMRIHAHVTSPTTSGSFLGGTAYRLTFDWAGDTLTVGMDVLYDDGVRRRAVVTVPSLEPRP